MAESNRPPAEQELERAMAEVGRHVAYPPTPDLVPAVRRRLAARPARRLPRPRALPALGWGLGAAAAALVLLLGIVGAVSPSARNAMADRLGLRGVKITYTPESPTPAPSASPALTPVPAGGRLGLGERLALAEARTRVRYQVLTPTLPALGAPDEVYYGPVPVFGQVSLVYYPRPGLPQTAQTGVGLLLTQFRGSVAPEFFGKLVGPDTRIEQVMVNGAPGYWIEGRPHTVFYRDATGVVSDERVRLAANVLLWEQDGLTLRLESALSKGEALRIAESVR